MASLNEKSENFLEILQVELQTYYNSITVLLLLLT